MNVQISYNNNKVVVVVVEGETNLFRVCGSIELSGGFETRDRQQDTKQNKRTCRIIHLS